MTTSEDNTGASLHLDDAQPGSPPHSGLFLRREIVERRELSVSEAAETLRVLQPTLSAVLNGRAALSPKMILWCGKASGLSMDALMSMQRAYDATHTRGRAHDVDVPTFVPRPKPGQGSLLWATVASQTAKVALVDFRPHIVIVTKRKIYDLEPEAVGHAGRQAIHDQRQLDDQLTWTASLISALLSEW